MGVRSVARGLAARLQLKLAGRALRVDIDARGVGLFAQVNWVYHLTRFARSRSLVPWVRLQSQNYGGGGRDGDWFADFFTRRYELPGRPPAAPIRIRDLAELRLETEPDLGRRQAHDLFFSYYGLAPAIEASVAAFAAERDIGPYTLGVHFRGTDKTEEAPRVRYEAVEAAIRRRLDADPQLRNLFVATDEAAFPPYLLNRFSDREVHFFEAADRSVDDRPLHLQPRTPHACYRLGAEALSDALMLSRCGGLIRTASFLSAWSCIFSPDLPVTTLNRPFAAKTWFPDRILIES